jgi:cytochrome c oxidase assembly protein subunit 15
MVVVTSQQWQHSPAILVGMTARRPRVGRLFGTPDAKLLPLAVVTAGLAYFQLVVGAVVRHSPLMLTESAARIFQIAVYMHVVLAAVVVFHVLWLAHRGFWSRISRVPSVGLALLVSLQVLLGVATWMLKYGMPAWATNLVGETGHFNRASDAIGAAIITAHGAVGSLIVAVCVVVALQGARRAGVRPRAHASAPRIEGVMA